MTDYIHIGKIVASFGLKGEVIIKHALDKKLNLNKGEILFVEQTKDSYLPYFIEYAKAKTNDELIVKFEDVNIRESTQRLLQKKIWITAEAFEKHADKNAPIGLLGYTIINDKELLGEVIEIIEQPHQIIAVIQYHEKEAMIPLHGETLKKVDRKKKQIQVSLPEGLLDLYK